MPDKAGLGAFCPPLHCPEIPRLKGYKDRSLPQNTQLLLPWQAKAIGSCQPMSISIRDVSRLLDCLLRQSFPSMSIWRPKSPMSTTLASL